MSSHESNVAPPAEGWTDFHGQSRKFHYIPADDDRALCGKWGLSPFVANAREAVQQVPAVREEKVAEIKQRVSDGTYTVSSQVLARKMVDAAKNSS